MPGHGEHDIAHLEARIMSLREGMAKMADDADDSFEDLIRIIHFPGWTTLPEYMFVLGIVDSMLAHVEVLAGLNQVLMGGSRAIGVEAK